MQQFILILHVLAAISVIALVLLQQGKGADIGATFGSGASNTMFGSQGALPFMVKLTAVLAAIFFATSLTLSYVTSKSAQQAGTNILLKELPQTVPVVPPAVMPNLPPASQGNPNK
ncbi:MAG: preprotein translocase subunit SecG [Gammaproteobacteria bacterium]